MCVCLCVCRVDTRRVYVCDVDVVAVVVGVVVALWFSGRCSVRAVCAGSVSAVSENSVVDAYARTQLAVPFPVLPPLSLSRVCWCVCV